MAAESTIYSLIHNLVWERTGLTLAENRLPDALRGYHLDAPYDFASVQEIVQKLRAAPLTDDIWQPVLKVATIGETYFYRNKSHMKALEEKVLPDLIQERRRAGQNHLRIWSAGCATGEEPYSVAMMLREMLPDVDNWFITIIGTDINLESLQTARQGVYKSRSFRSETRDSIQDRWFIEANGSYQLVPSIRSMVQFKPLNLIDDSYPSYETNTMNMDIILCRNVTIYFTREQTQIVARRFYEALNVDGWLIVGHSEPQAGVYDSFKTHMLDGATCYRKQAELMLPEKRVQPRPSPLPERAPIAKPKPKTAAAKPPRKTPIKPAPAAQPAEPEASGDMWHKARDAANHERWDEALETLAQMEAQNLLQPQVHYLRGLIWLQTDHTDAARESLRQAIYCDPGFALAHYTMGDYWLKQQKPSDALKHWKLAQRALSGMDAATPIAFENDLTVEALNDLLTYQIQQIEAGS